MEPYMDATTQSTLTKLSDDKLLLDARVRDLEMKLRESIVNNERTNDGQAVAIEAGSNVRLKRGGGRRCVQCGLQENRRFKERKLARLGR